MRRTPWSRAFAVLMAVWLAVSLAEPAILHACPVHGGIGAEASHAAMPHAMHHPVRHEDQARHLCSCIGACCSAAPIGLATAPISVASSAIVVTTDALLPEYSPSGASAEHVLPFANGPPAAI